MFNLESLYCILLNKIKSKNQILGENSKFKLALKLRICVRFGICYHFLCGACGCPYNDLVICKDISDCLVFT